MDFSLFPVPAFSDNYIWLLAAGPVAVAVDPGDAAPVRLALTERRLTLAAVLVTHHHPGFGVFRVLDIPGHTAGHIAYGGHGIIFCGDTLFSAGCGRLFEGTAAEMCRSLAKLAALPDTTAVCCGHEYTLANLKFAREVEPDNREVREYTEECAARRARGEPTLPSRLDRERRVNPFLRCDEPAVRDAARRRLGREPADAVEVFAAIRAWKDAFS